jgi:hypothetical protein
MTIVVGSYRDRGLSVDQGCFSLSYLVSVGGRDHVDVYIRSLSFPVT